ncbi:twin-arginine translocation signal domain-containing protein [Pedobacter frigidisoli]|uniref:Twin-arginine translocation signal domain-containing protein n=1 Tax=Pedobacter frigidisoli TaxID=2530455 RepID=A0A4V2MMM1_9SPHI|nr:TIM barrel protein [Pedobacter frigidisoli]TCD07034.1 twin-arginine translocation signal domain-containing protein [Pedobacter frigidisoli]
MTTRRSFLQKAGLAGAAAFISPSIITSALAHSPKVSKIGIGLFTLREQLTADVKATIEHVAKIGYNQVETYYGYPGKYEVKGFWGLEARDFNALLKANNLTSPSGHYNVTEFLSTGDDKVLKSHIEVATSVGQKYFVIPALPTDIRTNGTFDDYKKMAARFNTVAELCKKSGLKLAYHNHNFEFKDQGKGITGYEILLSETDTKLVGFELDIFWAVNAGLNPVDMFKKNPGRYKMFHVKDMDKQDKAIFTEVGSGRIDFKSIFAASKTAGLDYIFTEQDLITKEPFESITESYNYVKNQLI